MDEMVCLMCHRLALELAADRLADQFTEAQYLAFGEATEEMAVNLVESGEVACQSHRNRVVVLAG